MARTKSKKEVTENEALPIEESEGDPISQVEESAEDLTPSAPELPADQSEIVDVKINMAQKRPFRINGDNDRVIRINVSDMGMYGRLKKGYDDLLALMREVAEVGSSDKLEADEIEKLLTEYNQKMKDIIDYIFDSPVADACSYGGTMWDLTEGMFRFEHIIEALCGLCENNISHEFVKMRNRVNTRVTQIRQNIPAPKARR